MQNIFTLKFVQVFSIFVSNSSSMPRASSPESVSIRQVLRHSERGGSNY